MVAVARLTLRCARERRRRRRSISRIKAPVSERPSRLKGSSPRPAAIAVRPAALCKVREKRGRITDKISARSGIITEEGNSNYIKTSNITIDSMSISITEELGMEVCGGDEGSARLIDGNDDSRSNRITNIIITDNNNNNNININKNKEEEEEGEGEGELQVAYDGGWVRSIKELVDGGIDCVPAQYIRPPKERPLLAEVCLASDIPTIDLRDLLGPRRHHVIDSLHHACRHWGLFRVTNHGIPERVIESMLDDVEAFFQLPLAERTSYINIHNFTNDKCDDINANDDCSKASSPPAPASSTNYTSSSSSGSDQYIVSKSRKSPYDVLRQPPVTYVTSFNQRKEKLLNWKDSLRFHYSPLHMDNFRQLPSICQKVVFEFCKEAQGLASRLYEAISEGLGLDKQGLKEFMGDEKAPIHVNMHYYPPCPNPSLTYGLGSHSDPNTLTLLLSNQVNGLQFFKDGSWLVVESTPQSLLFNIGDQLQILTNGEYKSVEHRVVTNSERPRVSVATFFGPAQDTMVGPHPRFVGPDLPPLYKATAYADYVANFYNRGLSRKASLDFASLSPC